MTERKKILLRLDPAVHDALARWAGDELRSTTAQIEYLLRQSLAQAGRLPGNVGAMPRRGRPPRNSGGPPEDSGRPPQDTAPASPGAGDSPGDREGAGTNRS